MDRICSYPLPHWRSFAVSSQQGDPSTYADEYDLGELTLPGTHVAATLPLALKTMDGHGQSSGERQKDQREVGHQWNQEAFFVGLALICSPEGFVWHSIHICFL